jgi:hypothetical protein
MITCSLLDSYLIYDDIDNIYKRISFILNNTLTRRIHVALPPFEARLFPHQLFIADNPPDTTPLRTIFWEGSTTDAGGGNIEVISIVEGGKGNVFITSSNFSTVIFTSTSACGSSTNDSNLQIVLSPEIVADSSFVVDSKELSLDGGSIIDLLLIGFTTIS